MEINFKRYFYFMLIILLVLKFFVYLLNININIFFLWFILVLIPTIFLNIHYRAQLVNFIKLKFPLIYKKIGNNFIMFDFVNDYEELKNNVTVEKYYILVKKSYGYIGLSFIVLVIFIIIDSIW
jgi:hypothetical protein